MVESIAAAASGLAAAVAMLDDSARRQLEPKMDQQSRAPELEHVPRDLSGSPRPGGHGYIFAPGFSDADWRGLVQWPRTDSQSESILAKRSAQANAAVFRQARQTYEQITAMTGSNGGQRSGR